MIIVLINAFLNRFRSCKQSISLTVCQPYNDNVSVVSINQISLRGFSTLNGKYRGNVNSGKYGQSLFSAIASFI